MNLIEMKSVRVLGMVVVGLALLYPLSYGPAARMTREGRMDWFTLNSIYNPLMDDNAVGSLMEEYRLIWVGDIDRAEMREFKKRTQSARKQ